MARDDLKRGAVPRKRLLTHREKRHLSELSALIVAMLWIRVQTSVSAVAEMLAR